ncbi:hypothetical protein Patl1_28393 [Pistacia atlantica]|uniref:Uncharacterized protein n=1 Tax=Pistacia atlantica TaxID=434234 RepID=A0ACC1BH80_9ROSI|nr:hypothetical protein Patl1_28393 [Pistacia atlantica]
MIIGFRTKQVAWSITRPVVNYKAYGKVRDFNIDSGKRCYNFTTNKDQEYLIRGTFLYGDREGTPLGSSFNVWIGVTPLSVVNSSEDSVVEGIFRAVDDQTDFCLVKDKGNPYISQLELRPLNEPEYLHGQNSSVLKVVGRFDLGRSDKENSFRYPDDPYDRIWSPKLNPEQTTHSISSNTTISNNASTVTVPLQVLQTALNTSLDHLTFLHTDLDSGDYNYTINLYFLELQDSVKNSSQRVFDIYINNEKKQNKFDILAGGSNYAKVVMNVTANGHLNLTLVKEHAWVQESDKEDVNVIGKVRDDLKMDNKEKKVWESWSGDPCLPIPWEGLTCNSINGSTVITELNLPSRKLQGVLPISVTELVHLEKLYGSINAGFSVLVVSVANFSFLGTNTNSMHYLLPVCIMDLSHNDFTGRLPDSLILLPHLKTLNFGCNPRLDIPSTFNISRLTTDGGTCSSQGSTHKGIIIGSVACGKHPIYYGNLVFSIPSMDDGVMSIAIQTYTLEHIENATQKYKTLIGEGGFGSVYRGTLPDGQEVAVKVRSSTSTQGTREFENELFGMRTWFLFFGYCCENDQQILVYPFMSNGSLLDRLYGEAAKRKTLDWPTRLSIALGAARGKRSLIHRDVKSSNILLDHSMCAKVADFGFSKYAPQEGDSGVSLEVRGTAGYLDPEISYLQAKPYIRESKIEEIVDPSIKGGYHAEAMWRMVEVALACIEPFSAYRPCMSDIVRELEDALIIENNASEYMKSIDSIGGYSLGGSNRYSIVMEKRNILPPTPSPTEPSPVNTQTLAPPEPR